MTHSVPVTTLAGHDFGLPPVLDGLGELAYNLWWAWNPRARALFARIDSATWGRHRNPIPVLTAMNQARWSDLLADEDFLVDASRVLDEFTRYMNGAETTAGTDADAATAFPGVVGYFCAEYGLHESMQIYSGGLGVLAGDTLKAGSDAGLPMVAVGLLYRRGYFRQQIDADGHQEHAQPDLDPASLPLRKARARDGSPLRVSVEFPGRLVHAAVWVAQVGRIPLLLLDTDLPANDHADRPITHILYVRGREMRLCQELVLGIGGVRALRALGISPTVWHLNEGHSAPLLLERASVRMAEQPGTDPRTALREVGRNAVLTIHTPVPAGNESFERDLVRRLLAPWVATSGMPVDELLELGRGVTDEPEPAFDLTAFVLRHAADANAVSKLHAATATATWQAVAGHPIRPITNGVHMPTWAGRPIRRLYRRASGDALNGDPRGPEAFAGLAAISDEQMWSAHQQQKRELVEFARRRLARQFARHGEAPHVLHELYAALDPDALIIGSARRFATYKRADLLFRDEARLVRLMTDPQRPVQLVLAGKAHPADRPGQRVIQHIFQLTRENGLRGRVFILEDYDMRIARYLVAGVDLWLNTPRRPLEASGTSGMKAAMNGVPSVSILDGWWDEGFNGENGWAIGGRESLPDEAAQDDADAAALYRILEDEVVPRFYARDGRGLPHEWLDTMRAAASASLWPFSSARMLAEYREQVYRPLAVAAAPTAQGR